MLKHGILGLLNYGSMTGYQVMEVFRDSLNFFWTAQTSQIYRELQNMEMKGWVESVFVPQSGKPDKKLYSLTDAGKAELKNWLSREDSWIDNRSTVCMSTFFRGALPSEENVLFFHRIIDESESFLNGIERPDNSISAYSKAAAADGAEKYWRMTLMYGVMYRKMLIEWAKSCISILTEEEK